MGKEFRYIGLDRESHVFDGPSASRHYSRQLERKLVEKGTHSDHYPVLCYWEGKWLWGSDWHCLQLKPNPDPDALDEDECDIEDFDEHGFEIDDYDKWVNFASVYKEVTTIRAAELCVEHRIAFPAELVAALNEICENPPQDRDSSGLTATQRFILTAAAQLGAFDRASAQTLEDICDQAGVGSPDNRNVRAAMDDPITGLKARNLLATKRGRSGGHWLTAEGRRITGI